MTKIKEQESVVSSFRTPGVLVTGTLLERVLLGLVDLARVSARTS